MDFLDSVDLDTTHQKCHRVRSWYLYEQYKSLEKNQSDAARRLKNKSNQDKILKQEMQERKSRRRLCDNFGSCQSESKLDKVRYTWDRPKTSLSVNADDLYDSFCELHDDHLYDFGDNVSQDSSQTSKNHEEFKSVDDKMEDSENESVDSVVKNVTFENNLADDVKGELEIVKKNIAENINLQLETVKENIECLEKFTKLGDVDDLQENHSSDLFEQCESTGGCTVKEAKKFCPKNNKDCFPLWEKLVIFTIVTVLSLCSPYYSAMFYVEELTKCPYVSPVKYATSDSDISSIESYDSVKRKTSVLSNKCHKKSTCDGTKHKSCNKKLKSCRKKHWFPDREYQSENKFQQQTKYSFDNRFNELKHASEPWRSTTKLSSRHKHEKSSSSIWPEEFSSGKKSENQVCKCHCLSNVATPLLELAHYIESVLQDIED